MRFLRKFGWAALAAAAVSLCGAVPAHASINDDAFIATLEKLDIPYGSAQAAIEAGHATCSLLDSGLDVVQVSAMLQTRADMSPHQADEFVGASVGAYCPQYADQITGQSSGSMQASDGGGQTI